MKEKITIEDLREWGACDYGEMLFSGRFPHGATLDELVAAVWVHPCGAVWLVWLARNMSAGIAGDSIERRLSWCRNGYDCAVLARRMPAGLMGDTLERRLSWCHDDRERLSVRERYAGMISAE